MNQVQFWVQIGIGLLTIAGSGVLATFVTHRFHVHRESRTIKRERLEETFALVTAFCKNLHIYHLPFERVATGELDKIAARDIADREVKSFNLSTIDRIRLMVDMYFPELQTSLSNLLHVRDDLALARTELLDTTKIDHDILCARYRRLFKRLIEVERGFLSEICRASKMYT